MFNLSRRLTERNQTTLSRLFFVLVPSIAVLVLVIDVQSIPTRRFRDTIKLHSHPSQHRMPERIIGILPLLPRIDYEHEHEHRDAEHEYDKCV